MSFWKEKPAAAENLRLFMPTEGWKAYSDIKDSDKSEIKDSDRKLEGSKLFIESAFLNALNATNLILMTGSGSSFAAKNNEEKKQAVGMKQIWDAVKTATGEEPFNNICRTFKEAEIHENIERLLTLCKLYLELNEKSKDKLAAEVKSFVQKAEAEIEDKVDFIDKDTKLPAHEIAVQRFGRRGIRKPRGKIFTTNYDLCFEEAARRHKFTVIDGFSHALDQTYDRSHFDFDIVRREMGKETPNFIENVFHLYKLHGSIDWRRFDGEIKRSREKSGQPVLIYPRSSKYQESFEIPYLDMISNFQMALREPDTALIISGFGFNDDHLSRPILSAVESNMSLRLIVCDPAFINDDDNDLKSGKPIISTSDPKNKFLNKFISYASDGDPRIHLMNGRFEDMACAMPDLIGQTDRERHMERVRSLSGRML